MATVSRSSRRLRRLVGLWVSLVLGVGGMGGAEPGPLRVTGGSTSFELWPSFGDVGLELVGGDRLATEGPGVLVTFSVDPSSGTITPRVEGRSFFGFGSGSFRHLGRALLRWPEGEIDLSGFALRSSLRVGSPDTTFDLLDAMGEIVFLLDHAHASVRSDPPALWLENMDLRIPAELADRMGRPELANLVVGRGTVVLPLTGDLGIAGGCVPDFSGEVNVELTELTTVSQVARSGGRVAFAPGAELTNVGSADIPWYRAIVPDGNCGTSCVGPHPLLVMSLYRSYDGRLEQIGRSDVKHAFFSGNTGCTCQADQILYVGCSDLYGANTNWWRFVLGPRDEVTASTAAWSSLGSHFDGEPVDDVRDHTGETDDFTHRLTALESALSVSGARYFIEGWYLVAGDVDIFDSMAHREVDPTFSTLWTFPFLDATTNRGSIVDEWVDSDALGPGERNEVVVAHGGHLQLATRAEDLGGGWWRYRMVLMNHDFDRQVRALSIPVGGAAVRTIGFSDGDADGANDWAGVVSSGRLAWEAPSGPSGPAAVDWGVLVSFEYEADHPPTDHLAALDPLEGAPPGAVLVSTLVPADVLFADDLESGSDAAWSAAYP